MQITLLEENQIWTDKALSVMKQYRIPAAASDLAVILGASVLSRFWNREYEKATVWWSVTGFLRNSVECVYGLCIDQAYTYQRSLAGRPALSPSVTLQIPENQVRFAREVHGAKIVEYGEYPQSAVDIQKQAELTDMQTRNQLSTTGKKYTFDTVNLGEYDIAPRFVNHNEYTDGNARYVCVLGKRFNADSITRNGISVESGKKYWLRVEPIEWLADPSGWWVAKDCLFAGIRFNPRIRYDGNFEKTEMFAYLNNYFAQQMMLKR